ncbi:hypothetical protein EZ449_21975 [Pedobacter frigidisoli]|uniref:Uncharacterized protein n=1 Tax=Pedobacter frigidisoli TaxID=2530455 RepID=A0A4R0NB55_9SPHI|nr:hypothetical protein [Pedobacter frigidisoli]TCC97490.1 hypothetical protein EZ449_21975 [Pedobacter frigidisoli]
MTLKITLTALITISTFNVKAQIEFPVYKPLPPVQRIPPPQVPVDDRYRMPQTQTIYVTPQPNENKNEREADARSIELDKVEGFNGFKLGASLLLTLGTGVKRTDDLPGYPNLTRLKVLNTEEYDLYGEPIKNVVLEFLDDKLVSVMLELMSYNPDTNDKIRIALLEELSSSYGEWNVIRPKVADAKQNVSSLGFIFASHRGLMFKRFNTLKDMKSKKPIRRGEVIRIFNEEFTPVIEPYFKSTL